MGILVLGVGGNAALRFLVSDEALFGWGQGATISVAWALSDA